MLSKWYYSVVIDKPTNLIISLHQDEDRIKEQDSRKQMMDISLSILRQDSNANEISHIETLDFSISPNIQVELSLPPGTYIILPRTTGCFFGRPNDKLLQVVNTPLYNAEEKKLTPIFVNTIKDIFKKFDMLLNRELKLNEFRGFWECVNSSNISLDEFNTFIKLYNEGLEGLSEQGFINFFEDFYLKKGEVTI